MAPERLWGGTLKLDPRAWWCNFTMSMPARGHSARTPLSRLYQFGPGASVWGGPIAGSQSLMAQSLDADTSKPVLALVATAILLPLGRWMAND